MSTMAARETAIRIPRAFTAVEVRADTLNVEDRTVEVIWTTGAKVKRYSWDEGYYMEELAVDKKAVRLDRFGAMSLLDTHEGASMKSRLGTVVPGSVRIEGGKGYARIRFSKNQLGEEIFRDLQDGHPVPISVGYKIHRYDKTEGSDKQLPVLRAVDWEPMELSAVPIPADHGAVSLSRSEPNGDDFYTVLVRLDDGISAAAAAPHKDPIMTKRDAAKKFSGEQLDALALGSEIIRKEGEACDTFRARLLAAYDAEDEAARKAANETQQRKEEDEAKRKAPSDPTPPGQQPPASLTEAQVAEAMRGAIATERGRVEEIHGLARSAGIELGSDTVRKAINENTTVEAFRSQMFDHMVSQQGRTPTFPHVETRGGRDAQDTMRCMIVNAILHRMGKAEKLEDGAREWRSMGAMDIAREILRARGESTRGSSHEIAARSMHTTSDFPLILQDITRVTLLNAYQGYENTFQLFATRTLMTDYRSTKVLDIGSAPDLKLKNEHGEFESGTVRESEESMKLQRYGRAIAFTHEMLVNDQLGQFMDVVANWGSKVAKLEGDIVWGAIINNMKLMDGKGLYHADHKNLAAAGTALDLANLKKARLAYRQQKSIDGEPINVTPKYLFTGSDLEVDAQTLITSTTTPTTIEAVVPQAIKSLVPVFEHRLDILNTLAWLLFGDASSNQGRGIHYLHLQGHETPTTAEQIGFKVEGVEYTIAHSFGVGLTDYRFTYKNPGVARS